MPYDWYFILAQHDVKFYIVSSLYTKYKQKSEDKRRERLMCSKMFQVTGENKNEKSSSAPEHLDLIRKFQESTLEELKLNSASYTGRELDSLAEAASQLNLTVQKNKEKEKWISLTIKKIS
ncbi:hypothetical protein EB796_024067 [Bugula neritina]|uniref:Uncharacterized protein n=1 Tax=Bugula neritina TaxID=10212 RepID=A0A7J7IW29_BUGNE|nr:hypothetical protein EB796_024067 [Bugula neritina]